MSTAILQTSRASMETSCDALIEVVRARLDAEHAGLCENMINEAKNTIMGQMSRLADECERLKRTRDDILRRSEEVQACADLLTAERIYTIDETERLAELLDIGGPLPPDFERDFHIRAALLKCATEYGELDRRILAEVEMASSASRKLVYEMQALDKEWDGPYESLMRDVQERTTRAMADLVARVRRKRYGSEHATDIVVNY